MATEQPLWRPFRVSEPSTPFSSVDVPSQLFSSPLGDSQLEQRVLDALRPADLDHGIFGAAHLVTRPHGDEDEQLTFEDETQQKTALIQPLCLDTHSGAAVERMLRSPDEQPRPSQPLNCWAFSAETNAPIIHMKLLSSNDISFESLQTHYPLAASDAAVSRSRQVNHVTGQALQYITLEALQSASTGQSSRLFRWDAQHAKLLPVSDNFILSGYSAAISQSLYTPILEQGSLLRNLHAAFAESPGITHNVLPALATFAHIVRLTLSAVDAYIYERRRAAVRSVEPLTELAQILLPLLRPLFELQNALALCQTNLAVIRAVLRQAKLVCVDTDRWRTLFAEILRQMKASWYKVLLRAIWVPSSSRVEHSDDASLDLSTEDLKLMSDIKSARVTLYQQRSAHWASAALPLSNELQRQDNGHVRGSQGVETSGSNKMYQQNHNVEHKSCTQEDTILWSPFSVEKLTSAGNEASQLGLACAPQKNRNIMEAVEHALDMTARSHDAEIQQHGDPFSDDVLAAIRPVLIIEARLNKQALLRFLLQTCQVRDHLEMHGKCFLLNDADFAERLSFALFGGITATSIIPTNESGFNIERWSLRLNHYPQQKWPPRTSEVTLSLIGVIMQPDMVVDDSGTDSRRDDRLDYLHLSLRELDEADTERSNSPDSIAALDFIQLISRPAPPVDLILTEKVLKDYDRIFRWMLVVSRLQHIRKLLHFNVVTRAEKRQELLQRRSRPHLLSLMAVVHEINHFISSIATYTFDSAVRLPWERFMARLELLKQSMGDGDVDCTKVVDREALPRSLDELRDEHNSCIETILMKLFLSQSHARLHSGIGRLVELILRLTPVCLDRTTSTETLNHTLASTLR